MLDPFDFDDKEFAQAIIDALLVVGLAIVLILALGEIGGVQ